MVSAEMASFPAKAISGFLKRFKNPRLWNEIDVSLKYALRVFFGGICCIGFALFVIVSTPIYAFRQCVILFGKLFRSDLGDILNAQSTIFAHDLFSKKPPRCNIIVTITMIGELKLETLKKDWILKNWIHALDKTTGRHLYPKFQQYPYPWLGFIFWKNAFNTFDLDNHVDFHPNFGNPQVSKEELRAFTEQLLNAPFHPERSPWQLHLIHGYRDPKLSGEAMSVLILKIHHSLADGYSIRTALVEGLLEKPMSNMVIPEPRYPKRNWKEQILYWTTMPAMAFHELSYSFANTFRESAYKVPDEKKTWHQLHVKSDPIPIQQVKDIKNAFGVSFTSVLLSAISAGIYNNLEGRRKNGEKFIDDGSMFCLSALPVPGHQMRLTNHATGALFDIPTIKFRSPVERLRHCDTMLESIKRSVIPRLTRFYVFSIGCHLTSVSRVISKNNMVSTGLSNFPSVPIQIEQENLKGVAVDFAAGALQGDAGAGFMALSYGKHIRIVLTAERAIMSREDVNEFIRSVINEINVLYRLASVRQA